MNEWIKIRWYINVLMTCIALRARFEPRMTSLRAVWCFKSSWTASNWALPSQAAALNVFSTSLMRYWHAKAPGDKNSTHASNISNNRSNLIFGCIINEWIAQAINGSTLVIRTTQYRKDAVLMGWLCPSFNRKQKKNLMRGWLCVWQSDANELQDSGHNSCVSYGFYRNRLPESVYAKRHSPLVHMC